MNIESSTFIVVCGLTAIFAALIYAIGDVFLLSGKVNLADHPRLEPHAKTLSGTERMADLSNKRLIWGGLLGVFATPLVLAGFWQVYSGLQPAGAGLALPPVLLFVAATVVGGFLHGSFIYLGEYVQALDRLDDSGQGILLEMYARHRRIMIIIYGFIFICILAASIWFSLMIASGRTLYPRWMAVVNPPTMLLVWFGVKKLLPRKVTGYTEGAGFNIAYLFFFALSTLTLWQAAQMG